jgi:hypothetical protein
MSRRRRDLRVIRYWHAGWSGRQIGELLLPIARQRSRYAEIIRIGHQQSREQADDPDVASRRIYDINKLFVTADRNFAHAWAVCVPDAEKLEPLKRLYGIRGRAYYEVELLDASDDLLHTPPEPDPDYAVGSFQVDMARVIAVHRPQMSRSAAQVHMLRMATTPRNI